MRRIKLLLIALVLTILGLFVALGFKLGTTHCKLQKTPTVVSSMLRSTTLPVQAKVCTFGSLNTFNESEHAASLDFAQQPNIELLACVEAHTLSSSRSGVENKISLATGLSKISSEKFYTPKVGDSNCIPYSRLQWVATYVSGVHNFVVMDYTD